MEHKTFHIPFGVLRGLLPPDGKRLVVWRGRQDQWKQNRIPFERHETAEIAFGRAIRAQQKHRDDERSLSPGITCTHGSLQLRGGWAAHKAVDHHNDYFDGEFHASVTLTMRHGDVVADVSVPRLTWNESFVGKLGNLVGNIADNMVEAFRQQMEAGLKGQLQALIGEKMDEVLEAVPGAKVAREHVSIELLPDQVALTIRYDKAIVATPAMVGHLADRASREIGSAALGKVVATAGRKVTSKAGSTSAKVARPSTRRVVIRP